MGADPGDLTSIHVQRAVQGDGESLEWVVARLDPFVRAQVRFRLGSRARQLVDVDDLVAEVWVVAIEKVGELRPSGRHAPAFVRFLSTTVTNVCNNFLRRTIRRRERGLAGSGEPDDRDERLAARTRGVLTRVIHADVSQAIEEALDSLDEDKRQLLLFRLMEQRSNREIAEELGVPANTIAVRYRRALAQLREALPPDVFDGLEGIVPETE